MTAFINFGPPFVLGRKRPNLPLRRLILNEGRAASYLRHLDVGSGDPRRSSYRSESMPRSFVFVEYADVNNSNTSNHYHMKSSTHTFSTILTTNKVFSITSVAPLNCIGVINNKVK